MKTIIYHNPRCSKSRQALNLLEQKNIPLTIVRYLEQGLTKSDIEDLSSKLQLDSIRQMMRSKETEYKEQQLGNNHLSEQELITALINTPKLLERPIVVHGKKAAIGRPPENILDIFS